MAIEVWDPLICTERDSEKNTYKLQSLKRDTTTTVKMNQAKDLQGNAQRRNRAGSKGVRKKGDCHYCGNTATTNESVEEDSRKICAEALQPTAKRGSTPNEPPRGSVYNQLSWFAQNSDPSITTEYQRGFSTVVKLEFSHLLGINKLTGNPGDSLERATIRVWYLVWSWKTYRTSRWLLEGAIIWLGALFRNSKLPKIREFLSLVLQSQVLLCVFVLPIIFMNFTDRYVSEKIYFQSSPIYRILCNILCYIGACPINLIQNCSSISSVYTLTSQRHIIAVILSRKRVSSSLQ